MSIPLSAATGAVILKTGDLCLFGRLFVCKPAPALKQVYNKKPCGGSSMAEPKLPKLKTRVRFPSAAPLPSFNEGTGWRS